jgi:glycosyltransferase involved in cell wall biosynthesis
MLNPIVSVIMPVYNTGIYLKEAIDSIINQSFINFELIIIDDSSTDNSLQIIESYRDQRILLVKKDFNSGYTKSLNIGLKLAKGKYIARMDSDDISLPQRLEIQVSHLEKNPNIILCGTAFRLMNSETIINHPNSHDDILIGLLSGTAFGHPTVLIRREVLFNNNIEYNPNYEPAEDYYLWTQLIKFGRVVNLPEVLLEYRVHTNQVSKVKAETQQKMANKIRSAYFSFYFNTICDEKLLENMDIEKMSFTDISKEFVKIEGLLKKQIIHEKGLNRYVLNQLIYLQSFLFSSRKFQRFKTLMWIICHCPNLFYYNTLRFRISYILRSIILN